MVTLSAKQKQVLEFIRQKIYGEHCAPTIREIAGRFGFSSTGTVRDYLKALQKKGYVAVSASKARAIVLTDAAAGIPLVGRVAAGRPQLALEDVEGYLRPDELLGPTGAGDASALFALRVKGESMTGKGILDGDTVIVRRQSRADDGDIVVALIADEATVKTLRRRHNRLLLEPANSRYKPIACDENTAIIGKVIRVLRNYV
ncbi:MAG TPA: transcriptional repressor LexA [Candidatus Omnitrophota bacterium]|nr:transcriptional repressor LexA [Candidatus Omnitrophota bacterium]